MVMVATRGIGIVSGFPATRLEAQAAAGGGGHVNTQRH
jgi:hypothetical protein